MGAWVAATCSQLQGRVEQLLTAGTTSGAAGMQPDQITELRAAAASLLAVARAVHVAAGSSR